LRYSRGAYVGELIFVGLGLCDQNDISLRDLKEVRKADHIFVELYTSLMTGIKIEKLENLTQKRIVSLSREDLEDFNGDKILNVAMKGKTVFLVPGDPMIATTHIDLRIRAEKAGIKIRLIHGASIFSAAIGLTGLQNYKFGRSVTVPFVEGDNYIDTPYEVIKSNLESGLHTFCFLDIRAEERKYLTANEALRILTIIEQRKRESVIKKDTLVTVIARAGSLDVTVKANQLDKIIRYDFGSPPHSLIFPGKLHFMEAEALIELASAPESVKRVVR